jgi:hypothetical protein
VTIARPFCQAPWTIFVTLAAKSSPSIVTRTTAIGAMTTNSVQFTSGR